MSAPAGGAEERRAAAMRRAARELGRRPLSSAALRRRLDGVAPREVCDAVVADLERLGYVDDAALARALAERRLEQGWGAARVESDLERLGVGGAAARDGLAVAHEGEADAARALAARRGLAADPRRGWATLARRGFSEEAVEAALGTPDGL